MLNNEVSINQRYEVGVEKLLVDAVRLCVCVCGVAGIRVPVFYIELYTHVLVLYIELYTRVLVFYIELYTRVLVFDIELYTRVLEFLSRN